MKTTKTWLVAVIVALVTLPAGCGHSVKDVCTHLGDTCTSVPLQECSDDGNTVLQAADAHGCSDAFNTYLDCLAGASCDWATTCKVEHDALDKCTGPFPE
jgi:hypothetical protein